MSQTIMLHRYAGLARKVLSHYIGDRYNPETFDHEFEYDIRFYISGFVELKVFDRQPYDWSAIDHFFRFLFTTRGYPDIGWDDSILKKGYNGVRRGELPRHYT